MEVGFKYTATYNLVLARTFLSSIYAMCGQDTRILIEFRGQFVNLGKLGVVQVQCMLCVGKLVDFDGI